MTFHCPNCCQEKADDEEAHVSFFAHLGLFLMTKGTWWGGPVCDRCARQVTMVGWVITLLFGLMLTLSIVARR